MLGKLVVDFIKKLFFSTLKTKSFFNLDFRWLWKQNYFQNLSKRIIKWGW